MYLPLLRHAAQALRNSVLGFALLLPLSAASEAHASETAPPPASRTLATAEALERSGRRDEALGAYRALAGTLATRDVRRAPLLLRIANLEMDAGSYADAARDASDAAAGFFSDRREEGVARNVVGNARLSAGDYDGAAAALREALAASTAAGDAASVAEEMTNLGNVRFYQGRYGDARTSYDDAMQRVDAHRGEPWSDRRRQLILINRATLDQKLGRDREALLAYQQVRSTGTKLRASEEAQLLSNLGVLYRRLGDPIKALKAYDEAAALFAQEHHLDGELGVLKNRGIVLALDLEQLEGARSTFDDAFRRARAAGDQREVLQAQLYRAECELRLGQHDAASADGREALALARQLATPEEQWKALYVLARLALRRGETIAARQQLDEAIAVIESLRERIRVPSLKSDFFNDKRDVYDARIALALELDAGDPAHLFELIELGRSRGWRERLGLQHRVTLRETQTSLPHGVLLLEVWSSSSAAAVVGVTRERVAVRRVTVDPNAIRLLSDALARGDDPAWEGAAAQLSAQLLPEGVPPSIEQLIVVTDGMLTLIPFELLRSRGVLLLESVAVSYAPTAALLSRAPARLPSRSFDPSALELVAFGDPRVGSGGGAGDAPGMLRGSGDEVRAIARELGGRTIVHLAADDRKQHLLALPPAAPIVHIATHAVADGNAIERSRLLFSPAAGSSRSDELFLKEAYALPLAHVELAVLSACDTERGRMLRGEGVQSFSRAFLAAGARSTVTTLWRVPDAPTAAFMTIFYDQLQRGVSRAEALRRAKLRFLRSGGALRHPHYWAAFVLTGEGVRPVPTTLRMRSLVVMALAGAATLLAVAAVVSARHRG